MPSTAASSTWTVDHVVGHIYQLDTTFSGPLGATYVDEDGTNRPYRMGSHGIGISRILAAAAEQFNDDQGLHLLPKALAPFEVVVIGANADDERVAAETERIYDELSSRGVGVVVDDRDERAGVKFADADLVGYPVHIVVGSRGVAAGTADLKLRATGDRSQTSLTEAAEAAVALPVERTLGSLRAIQARAEPPSRLRQGAQRGGRRRDPARRTGDLGSRADRRERTVGS